jgi:hypothetical protein
MGLKIKRLSGSQYSADDVLEAQLDVGDDIVLALHTVNIVSGEQLTHGGGGAVGEHLHYKNNENDADANGIIDYSTVEIAVVQLTKGTSVVNVSCNFTTKAENDTFQTEYTEWEGRIDAFVDEGGDRNDFTELPPTYPSTTVTSGDITLEWSDDTLV